MQVTEKKPPHHMINPRDALTGYMTACRVSTNGLVPIRIAVRNHFNIEEGDSLMIYTEETFLDLAENKKASHRWMYVGIEKSIQNIEKHLEEEYGIR